MQQGSQEPPVLEAWLTPLVRGRLGLPVHPTPPPRLPDSSSCWCVIYVDESEVL